MSDIFELTTDRTLMGPDGHPIANGQIHFHDRKTGEYAPVYGDSGLTVALRQPVQADSSGVLPAIYLDDAVTYRAVITDRQNNRIREIDDVRGRREGIKVLGGIEALKRFCGNDPFVLVASKGGCPVFYKRLSGCDLPEEKLPEVVRAECGCDCSVAWQLCRSESDICAVETAQLNCDYHVLVQECPPRVRPDGTAVPDGTTHHGEAVPGTAAPAPGTPAAGGADRPCQCSGGGGTSTAPVVKKASIGALLSAAVRCLPRTCIPSDMAELAFDPATGSLVYGDRVPPPLEWSQMGAAWGGCLPVDLASAAISSTHHLRLDQAVDTVGKAISAPEFTLENKGRCVRRYEIRALNRLNRAKDMGGPNFGGAPSIAANFQTRLGNKGDPAILLLLNDRWGVGDYLNTLNWLTQLSIADSTMAPVRSGYYGAAPGQPETYDRGSSNSYTENVLIVDLAPGQKVTYVVKYHVYWDANVKPQQFVGLERLHVGTRIVARQVR